MNSILNPYLRRIFASGQDTVLTNLGLLLLRLGFGGTMLFAHGWSKLGKYAVLAASFPDPMGLGSEATLVLAIFAEVFCSALLMIGLGTRLAVIPLIITMLVAGFIVHAADPFAKQELAFLYLLPFIFLFLAGAGRYSLDGLIVNRLNKN